MFFFRVEEIVFSLRKIPGASPEVARLPLVIREKDVEYQARGKKARIILFFYFSLLYSFTELFCFKD